MRHINFDSAKTLQDVHDIQKNLYPEETWHRCEALMECARDSESIMEFGVNQGCSLVLMLLQNPKKIIGVDPQIAAWNKGRSYKPLSILAEEYAKENNIEIEFLAMSSTNPKTVRSVDMLHIDSLHTPKHLRKELKLHAQHIKKYIAFHDIKQDNYALWKVVEDFLSNNEDWKLKNMYDEKGTCGHAEIERVKK
tara:strand:- start:140 stop:721 length:582 start_codon:yes stop_codon:yes gene_type:complete